MFMMSKPENNWRRDASGRKTLRNSFLSDSWSSSRREILDPLVLTGASSREDGPVNVSAAFKHKIQSVGV